MSGQAALSVRVRGAAVCKAEIMNWKFNRQRPLHWSKPRRTGVKLKINNKKGVMSLDINWNKLGNWGQRNELPLLQF